MTIEGGSNPKKPKVVVISSTASAPLAAPEMLEEAQSFAYNEWKVLGIPPEKGFNSENFRVRVMAMDLKPVAFAYIRDLQHWVMPTFAAEGDRSRVFDTQVGLTEVNNSLITATYLFDVFGKWTRYTDVGELYRVNYNLPEYYLRGIGRVQTRPYDCGPLLLWAAKKALGK